MRFKVDENLSAEVTDLLRLAQHEAVTVADQGLSGAHDQQIVHVCAEEQRALVTLDLDFANVTAYPPPKYAGFIVLRLHRQDTVSVLNALRRAIPLVERIPVSQRLWIVDDGRIRVRDEEVV